MRMLVALLLATGLSVGAQDRAAWMQQAKWGVMTHYLADWQARVHNLTMNVEQWNKLVDGFDAEGIARQLASAGAGYYLITIGQNSGYYLSPNATYTKLAGVEPGKCSRRDLVADLYEALNKRGIKLMVYLPSGAPAGDQAAREALEWRNGPYPNREFQVKWEQVIREWAQRWGNKVAGWWFDGCYFPNSMYRSVDPPNFASFAAAARAGNPERAIAFNPGVVPRLISITPHEDYTAGELSDPATLSIRRSVAGRVDGAQVHVLSYLGRTWGIGDAPRFKDEQAIEWSRKVWEAGGAITWDAPVQLNGTLAQPFVEQLTAIGKAVARREPAAAATRVSIEGDRWRINGRPTYAGTSAEGLLMNVRMVNAVFEDRNRPEFDARANSAEFIAKIPEYVEHGIRAFTLSLQGGAPGYEGAVNSAFSPDGSLRPEYLDRVRAVIEACDRNGAVVILSCYYQRQDQVLRDEKAVRAGVVNVARWLARLGRQNVALEIANEFGHKGFDHPILKTGDGQAELIRLAKRAAPDLLVSSSGLGGGTLSDEAARAADFLLIHFNSTRLDDIPARIADLKKYGKPIVCNEDDKTPAEAILAAELSAAAGASWGLMLPDLNQRFPFDFHGASDVPEVYTKLRRLTSGRDLSYFPPPESQGGWRKLNSPHDVREIAGMDPDKLASLREWLLASDRRDFAAVVIRRGHVVLEVERNASSIASTGNVKSCAKAICATVVGIAAERSRRGAVPVKMTFDDPAFAFLPEAKLLSDARKARITVRQLLNHTSGITPESTGARNQGPWDFVMGHTGDPRTAQLAFDPGADLGYSTHAFYHAALVVEHVAGMQYDQFAIEALLKPIGIEKWWFEHFDGGAEYGRHATHAAGLPARELARIAYCMLRAGRWNGSQVVPAWFIVETGEPTHSVKGIKSFERNAESWSHGWELPARLAAPRGTGIPKDARFKPGSGGQLIAFVPSLDLVVVRQTGGSGAWEYEEYLRRACDSALTERGR